MDVAVIGAGPAGLMAAVQAVRQGLTVALFEKDRPGGQALAANLIENFPGMAGGITGPELMEGFLDQLRSHEVEITHARVVHVSVDNGIFSIETEGGIIRAKTAIIATGLAPKKLAVPGEDDLLGRRIFSYVPPSRVPHDGKLVTVIGGGDAAFDQAINFAKRARDVSIAMKGKEPSCAPLLFRRARDTGISFLFFKVVKSFAEVDDSILITFEDGTFLKTDIAITCIGKTTNFEFLDKKLIESHIASPLPFVRGGSGWGRSTSPTPSLQRRGNHPGLYFAGDCRRGKDRHIAIACGDGIEAAMRAAEFLK